MSPEDILYVGLRLAAPWRSGGQGYVHALPNPDRPDSVVKLNIREMSELEVGLAREHPFERPLQKVFIYWGCGESLRKGQPRVVLATADQSRLSRRLAPSPAERHWPKQVTELAEAHRWHAIAEKRTESPSALQGEHVLRGPRGEQSFRFEDQQGFLPPIEVQTVEVSAGSGVRVAWKRVPGAVAFFASTFVQNTSSLDVIIWTSSKIAEAGWLLARAHPGEEALKELLNRGVLMSSDARECAVPDAVMRHTNGSFVFHLTALGKVLRPPVTPRATAEAVDVQVSARATTAVLLIDAKKAAGSVGL